MLYVRKINLKNRNDSNVLLYEMTEAGSRVLDVGCACGDLSALLAERKNCRCVGLEADKEGVEVCRKRRVFDEVLQIDLNNFAAADYPRFRQSFDVIVCGDVLEHWCQSGGTSAAARRGSVRVETSVEAGRIFSGFAAECGACQH